MIWSVDQNTVRGREMGGGGGRTGTARCEAKRKARQEGKTGKARQKSKTTKTNRKAKAKQESKAERQDCKANVGGRTAWAAPACMVQVLGV